MLTIYPLQRMFSMLAVLLFSLAAKAADDGMGCFLHQLNRDHSTVLTDGYIAQTFDACENGRLEYLHFFIESTDFDTFGVRMSLHHKGEEIHSQQVVVPGKATTGAVKAWMANPPQVEAGESYEFRLWVPQNKAFVAYHSSHNLYESGYMKVSGLYMGTDLAFEAGVRFQQAPGKNETPVDETHCDPRQERTDQTIVANLIETQTLSFCDARHLDGILLYYTASQSVSGAGVLYKRHKEAEGPVAVMPFELNASGGITPFFLKPESQVKLEAGQVYSLSFEGPEAGLPDDFELYCSAENAYPIGRLHSPLYEESIDLAFQVFFNDGLPQTVPQMKEFTDHPWHDCVISQPYWNDHRTYEGQHVISIDLPLCDDGNFEAVYLPGKIISDTAIKWELLRSDGKSLATGKLKETKGFKGLLTADLGRERSLFYFNHRLVISLKEDDALQFAVNTKGDQDLPTTIDGHIAPESICYAVGMSPYRIRFEAADAESKTPLLKAWPNPFNDQFSVRIDHLNGRRGTLFLYSLQGVEVFKAQVSASDEAQVLLVRPTAPLEPGFYTIRFEYDDQILLETVICQ